MSIEDENPWARDRAEQRAFEELTWRIWGPNEDQYLYMTGASS
jgi:hypothetical protein